jgi:hypothetical protein
VEVEDNHTIRAITKRNVVPIYRFYSDIHYAYTIYQNNDLMRHIIEAMLLAKLTDEEIASNFGFTEDIIIAYRHLFFDLSHIANAKARIACLVAPRAIINETTPDDPDQFWKMAIIQLGSEALQLLMQWTEHPDTAKQKAKTMLSDQLASKAAFAAKVIMPNKYNALEILNTKSDMDIKDAEIGRMDEASDAAKELLSSVKVSLMSIDQSKDRSAIEPRAMASISALMPSRAEEERVSTPPAVSTTAVSEPALSGSASQPSVERSAPITPTPSTVSERLQTVAAIPRVNSPSAVSLGEPIVPRELDATTARALARSERDAERLRLVHARYRKKKKAGANNALTAESVVR